MKQLLEYVYKRVQYPEDAKKAGIEGRSVAQFLVRSDGKVTDAKIVRSIGYGTDEVVLAVINSMPVWRPGYDEGRAVNVEFTIPVSFKMADTPKADAPETSGSEVFKVVEEMPRFPGCEDAGLEGKELQQCSFGKLVGFIQQHMKYPEEAEKAGIEGKTVVQFIVRADGSITDAKIVRSIGYGTDAVVLDIVKAMPAWRPGYQRGKAVDVQMVLPVSFVLPPDKEQNKTSAPKAVVDLNIQVFPVPSGDKLNYTIDLHAGSGDVVIELLSQSGQVVVKDTQSLQISKAGSYSGSFNIGNVMPGTYVIRAQWAGDVVTKSVVIQ
jgi:TonB family protein